MAFEAGSVPTAVERLEQALIKKIEAGEVQLPYSHKQPARCWHGRRIRPPMRQNLIFDSPESLIDRAPSPLQFMDRELGEQFIKGFEQHGGRYLGRQHIEKVRGNEGAHVVTKLGDGTTINTEKILVLSDESPTSMPSATWAKWPNIKRPKPRRHA